MISTTPICLLLSSTTPGVHPADEIPLLIRCMVPGSGGVIISTQEENRYGKHASRQRPHDAANAKPASQRSKEKTSTLAQRYGLSRTTAAKWRTRTTTSDAPMGPAKPESTVLSPAEESAIVEFRRRTLLPLDDVMGCLLESIPKLSRSSLH